MNSQEVFNKLMDLRNIKLFEILWDTERKGNFDSLKRYIKDSKLKIAFSNEDLGDIAALIRDAFVSNLGYSTSDWTLIRELRDIETCFSVFHDSVLVELVQECDNKQTLEPLKQVLRKRLAKKKFITSLPLHLALRFLKYKGRIDALGLEKHLTEYPDIEDVVLCLLHTKLIPLTKLYSVNADEKSDVYNNLIPVLKQAYPWKHFSDNELDLIIDELDNRLFGNVSGTDRVWLENMFAKAWELYCHDNYQNYFQDTVEGRIKNNDNSWFDRYVSGAYPELQDISDIAAVKEYLCLILKFREFLDTDFLDQLKRIYL